MARGISRRLRVALAGILTGALLAAVGVTVWRVLRPADVSTPAITSYPESETSLVGPGNRGTLVAAPLIIDDRLRVFAKKREVWADGPPSYHYERSAYWSYRRWPAELIGVVITNSPHPVVVTTWSDGVIVGISAETGKVAWRIEGEALGDEFIGRRTGADTVYSPPGLFASTTGFVVSGKSTLKGYSAEGTQLWVIASPATGSCRGTEFATPAQYLVFDTCTQSVRRIDSISGNAQQPIGTNVKSAEQVSCTTVTSQCRALRTTSTDGVVTGWILTEAQPIESAPLARPTAQLAQTTIVVPNDPTKTAEISGYDAKTGAVLWRWLSPAPSTLLTTSGDRIIVLVTGRILATIDAKTGTDIARSGINLIYEPETPYDIRTAYAADGYVALERINSGTTKDATDDAYYFTHRPILMTVS